MNRQFTDLHSSRSYKPYPNGTSEGDVNLSNTPCEHIYHSIKEGLDATLIKYPARSQPYYETIEAMNNLDGMMRDLAVLSQEQKLQMICEAKRIKRAYDKQKSKEYYFHPGRRYWAWRHYRNPYMWYMYRPWAWDYY
jgi:hypothetical protein